MSDYNGWTNRETWLVNVWYNPESKDDVDYLEENLEDDFYELVGLKNKYGSANFYTNLIDFHVINWDELREHFEDAE